MPAIGRLALALVIIGLARPAAAAATRVACVGDSTTAGSGNSGVNVYTAPLARLLGAAFEVKNFGEAGTTLMRMPGAGGSYWGTPAFKASQGYAPDVVLIMLGTNDSKAANWRGGNNGFEADYRALIAVYAALPGKPKIHALLPPPLYTTRSTLDPKVIASDIPAIIRKIVADTGVGFIDVQAAFLPEPKKYFGAGDGVDIGDGTHPNRAGAELIAATVAPALATQAPDAGAAPADGSPVVTDGPGMDAPPVVVADALVPPAADAPAPADAGAADRPPARDRDEVSALPAAAAPATGGCALAGRGDAPAGALVFAVVALITRRTRRSHRLRTRSVAAVAPARWPGR